MAKRNYSLRDLDVDVLFKENVVQDIIQIQKNIDVEIEKKRVELRSMVGDRYKDILTASDAIISMKSISENIVDNINNLNVRCNSLIEDAVTVAPEPIPSIKLEQIEERTIVMQIHLTIVMNEHICLAIDKEDFSSAAQFYLLAQHIHTGLRLLKRDMMEKLPILKGIKSTLDDLRTRILSMVYEKLKTIQLTAEETSNNLLALILLQTDNSLDLLNLFMELRKTALISLIEKSHASVRIQVAAMVQCLVTTVHLIQDCFLCYENTSHGLIRQKLDGIINENSPTILSKIELPSTPLTTYIPDVIKQYRPKCGKNSNLSMSAALKVIEDWLKSTSKLVNAGLENSLQLVTNIKGLHIIRQEALKVDIPSNWEEICVQINLPNSFRVWNYFFQTIMSNRAQVLISKKISAVLSSVEAEVSSKFSSAAMLSKTEKDLRWYLWSEDIGDVSRTENKHLGLSMKTKGYSPTIVSLCEKLNDKCLEFWQDVYFYLFGKEYDMSTPLASYASVNESRQEKKYVDREKLEKHLREQCVQFTEKLIAFLEYCVKSEESSDWNVLKSIISARFLQALTVLCPYFYRCCVCSGSGEQWDKICNAFREASLRFWESWVNNSVADTSSSVKQLLQSVEVVDMFSVLPKWDTFEIQEQTEEKVFNSQIRIPSQPSLVLHRILSNLSGGLNAVLPHTLPKQVHLQYIERNTSETLEHYESLLARDLNQNQALQFLFDVKFVTCFCIPKENILLVQKAQAICDKLRSKVDPFDLDVFYSYIQNNVKQSVLQSQIILGCLLPASAQLANLGAYERNKEQDKDPSVLALSIPSTLSWFPLLPVTAPVQKTKPVPNQLKENNKLHVQKSAKTSSRKSDPAGSLRSGAASLFGAMTTDWFS